MLPEEAATAAFALLERTRAGRDVIVAAIDGCGGAGKSTLAQRIRAALDVAVSIVAVDDFYRPLTNDQRVALDPHHGYENYFDWQRMRNDAIIPLRAGKAARYQRYDWSTDRLAEWIEVAPASVVIVEGVYSSRPELRPLLDAAIFIDTPREERLRRMLSRGQDAGGWIQRWMAAEDWYLEHIEPMCHAHLVLPGV
jgi:uridine kinase